MPRYALWANIFGEVPLVQSEPEAIATRLGREIKVIEDGWKSEIDCGAIHPEQNWFAWKEYRERLAPDERNWLICNYYLHIIVVGRETLNWTIKTYNPAFGCMCHYLWWHQERLVMLYLENHRHYGVASSTASIEQIVDFGPLMAGEGAIRNETLYTYFPHWPEFSKVVRRFALPVLTEMEVMTIEQALSEGILTQQ